MRRKFGKLINDLAKKDDKIVLLVGDIGYGIFDDFRKDNPKRFFNLGICEQSLIGTAAGMSLEGLKPWVYTITPFLIERPFEQIARFYLSLLIDTPISRQTKRAWKQHFMIGVLPRVKAYSIHTKSRTEIYKQGGSPLYTKAIGKIIGVESR